MEQIEEPLPHSPEAERNALGAILIGAHDYEVILDTLQTDDFFLTEHKKIYAALLRLREGGKPTDLLALHDALVAAGEVEACGGMGYVATLGDGLPHVCRAEYIAGLVKEKALLRSIIHAAAALQQAAMEEEVVPENLLDKAIEKLAELARDAENDRDDGVSHLEAAVQAIMELNEKQALKIYTDVDELDRITGGFRAGELVILTAETGSGKTLLAQQTRRRACRDGHHSLFASGEMLAPHLKRRELAAQADVNPSKMRRDDLLSSDERKALMRSAGEECKICRILDGELDLSRIRRVARAMKGKGSLDLIVLDYDELIEAPGKDEFEQQRNLARAAKSIAMELRCAVILVSQLRKALTGEDVARPTLQRVYGSGAKTKHASIVILADREFVRELQADEKEAQLFVMKNRDGKVGRIKASFNIRTLRFEQAEREPSEAKVWRDRAQPREEEE